MDIRVIMFWWRFSHIGSSSNFVWIWVAATDLRIVALSATLGTEGIFGRTFKPGVIVIPTGVAV